jgi:hypothetical protein
MGAHQIDRLYEYCSVWNPSFTAKACGVNEDEIDVLQSLSGTAFGSSYRRFLHYFGKNTAGTLDPFLAGLSFSIDDAREFYDLVRRENGNLRPGVAFFLHDNYEFTWHLRMSVDADDDPTIVMYSPSDSLTDLSVIHRSFEGHLFLEAFIHYRLYPREFRLSEVFDAQHLGDQELFRASDTIATRFGFVEESFPANGNRCYGKENTSLFIGRLRQCDPIGYWVASDDKNFALLVAETLLDNVGRSR